MERRGWEHVCPCAHVVNAQCASTDFENPNSAFTQKLLLLQFLQMQTGIMLLHYRVMIGLNESMYVDYSAWQCTGCTVSVSQMLTIATNLDPSWPGFGLHWHNSFLGWGCL